ncbi:MAG: hypothetical protein ABEL76_15370 [Bradymonadaceae bacterium]
MNRRWLPSPALFTALVVVFTVGACNRGSSDDEGPSNNEKGSEARAPAKVELPDPPPTSAFEVQEKHPDGTFRVRGLVLNRHEHLGSTIRVRGVVSSISKDCDPAESENCPKPHLFIRDSKDARTRLMVVGFPHDFLDRAGVEEGKTYTFEGTYEKLSGGFVASKNGLLTLQKVGDEPVKPGK